MRGFIVEVKLRNYSNSPKTLYIRESKIKKFFRFINLAEWEISSLEFKSDMSSLKTFIEENSPEEDLETGEIK